jgi:hypothetical protein
MLLPATISPLVLVCNEDAPAARLQRVLHTGRSVSLRPQMPKRPASISDCRKTASARSQEVAKKLSLCKNIRKSRGTGINPRSANKSFTFPKYSEMTGYSSMVIGLEPAYRTGRPVCRQADFAPRRDGQKLSSR